MAGYSGGRIKKIKIVNFMTYDDVEIYPKQGLNLIVGLNGTGKSSIMCAICLGLAGKPQFTGRAPQLSDFIKHGCQEAEIEIQLESKHKDVVIRRKIKDDKSEWYINKSLASHNEVTNTVKKFNIDTNNLCQFLPQEKVADFSKMDKKLRLENMLQAIGEPHLFELFNELKELYKKFCVIDQNIKKCHVNKNSREEENMRISDDVIKQENRTRLKDELTELNKRKKISIYKDILDEYNQLKEKEKSLASDLKVLVQERNEATVQEQSIFNRYSEAFQDLQERNSQNKSLMNKLTNGSNVLTNFNEQVENEKIEYKNKLAEKEDQKKKIHEINKIIEGLARQLTEEINKCPNYEEQVQVNSQALAEFHSEISELYKIVERASAEKNRVEYTIMQLNGQLASLRDEQNKKLENLKRRDKQTYEATCWLLENRQRFKSDVYLPIMLEININSPDYTKYIENVIGFRDMIAFVCVDKSDCECLTDILKNQMKLAVNIVMAPDTPISNVSPLGNEYRRCGLEYFVMDVFNAPDPVMRYLCACCNIHHIPVTKSVVNSQNIEFILKKFPLFFSENMRISGKKSRYGQKNISIRKDFITSNNLLIHHNDELQQEVKQKLEQMQLDFEIKKAALNKHKAHLEEKEKILTKLRQEKKILGEHKRNIYNLKNTHIQKQKYRMQISVVIDEELEKEKITKKIRSINEHRERVLSELNSLFKDFIQLKKDIVKIMLIVNCSSKSLKLTRAANEDIHERVKVAETEFQKAKQIRDDKKRHGKRLYEELTSIGQLQGIELGTMEEIEQQISHVQAKLNLNEDNEALVNEYNSRKHEIEKIQQQINNLEDDLDELKQTLEEKKKEWLEPLQKHIENINKKFSRYFKQLSCAGEISLDIPENPDDFTKYGLQIKLKFHDDDPFTELSQYHHSGGECSVAAIVFILSLQELTEVPFRCIDEINQGMDSENERKIYQLIADSVGQDRCSQYFLLTPKLLDGLEYPDDVAVHIIFNSCFLKVKFNVNKHLEAAQNGCIDVYKIK